MNITDERARENHLYDHPEDVTPEDVRMMVSNLRAMRECAAEEDAGLLTVTYIAPAFGDLWEAPQNIGGADWAAYLRDSKFGVLWTEFGKATVVQDDGGGHASEIRAFDDVDDAIAHAERLA